MPEVRPGAARIEQEINGMIERAMELFAAVDGDVRVKEHFSVRAVTCCRRR